MNFSMDALLLLIRHVDHYLFFALNVSIANPLLDLLMPWVTDKHNWYLPGGVFAVLMVWKGGKQGRILVLFVILAIVLADQISSTMLKPLVARLRPCKALEGFRLLVHCGSRYGFPSSHAANAASVGVLLSLHYRRWTWVWMVLILLNGLSRTYVGVHYPGDVFAGWLLGALIGWALYRAYLRVLAMTDAGKRGALEKGG